MIIFVNRSKMGSTLGGSSLGIYPLLISGTSSLVAEADTAPRVVGVDVVLPPDKRFCRSRKGLDDPEAEVEEEEEDDAGEGVEGPAEEDGWESWDERDEVEK